MITLYHGSGSREIEVLKKAMRQDRWLTLRQLASKLLQAHGSTDASRLLADIPFELRDGTNGFRDEFQVLYWRAPFENYVELAEWADSGKHKEAFKQIASTVSEVANVFVRFIAVELDDTEGPAAVSTPSLQITSDVVERALRDAERLIGSSGSGAASALDRVHTALHGYLRLVCDKSSIGYSEDPGIVELMKLLSNEHRTFSSGRQSSEIDRILKALAAIVDALGPVRNRKSMAHPNSTLLADAEAMLVINTVRTVLHYVNAKVS